ncbi:MAG: hypothetical protein K8R08_04180 [Methanosarcinales archaeon]|nr:hypothetical protein [Methanosarcinales archaeon]
MKEKIAGYFLLAIAIIITLSAINISLSIISYSFYTGMLIWGIIAVLMIWIFIVFISGVAIIILNYFSIGPFYSTASGNLLLSDVKILGKKDAKIHDKIIIINQHNLVFIAIISIPIMVYSFYTGMLIWGIIAVVLIMILTCLLSGFILLVKNLLIASIKSLQE